MTPYRVYNYIGSTGDERLQEIKNLTPASAILSKFDYTYDAVGKILTWQQQTDSNTPTLWTDSYDAADQLTSAIQTSTAVTTPPLISGSYGYDAVGNMTTSIVGGISRSPTYNSDNQLTSSTPSGSQSIGFTGSLNALDTVTINGTAATVNGSNCFSGLASLTPGTTGTVSIVATDSGGNSRTNHYQTTAPAQPTYSGTYDNDGNELTTGAGQSYTWDVKSELFTIAQASGTSQFTFDALGHRISESDNGTLTKQWVWDGDTLAEERNASNTVTKRFYAQGEQISGTTYYYTRDHLGSIREVTGTSGAIQARYDYDPYGRATQLQGTLTSDFQYAGYYTHAASGLYFPVHRPYDPITARWPSRDPLGEAGGINLYGYVGNEPINRIDPLGLLYLDGNSHPVNGPWNNYDTAATLAPLAVPIAAEDGIVAGLGYLANLLGSLGNGQPQAPGSVLDQMSQSGASPDRGGLTMAGRSLCKHGAGARPGNQAFPPATGNPNEINQTAQDILDNILTDPGSVTTQGFRGRFGPTTEVNAPNGQGAVFDSNGNFIFFSE